jgi:hypothetical protein
MKMRTVFIYFKRSGKSCLFQPSKIKISAPHSRLQGFYKRMKNRYTADIKKERVLCLLR